MSAHDSQNITDSLLNQWGRNPANLLQILVELQQQFHHIPAQSIQLLATELKVTPANIEGVISFYSFLHSAPDADYVILFSDNIIERLQGCVERAQQLADELGCALQQKSEDGLVRVDFTACIGMSDHGPAALVNGLTLTNISAERVSQMAALIKQRKPLTEWPGEWFEVAANIQRRNSLLNSEFTHGAAIRAALDQGPQQTLNNLSESGLRGCGGAGFKTATKWTMCAQAEQSDRVVVCNADEGEPGTFKDRLLLQHYADQLFEGMTVCAATIKATQGFVYLRGEYCYMLEAMQQVLQQRRANNLLGQNILGHSEFNFDIEIHLGAGAYICGEESALIESLEGKRGIPRNRPPFPVTSGYLGRPTVVNNVETLVLAAHITAHGAGWFNHQGTEVSKGSKLLSISGDCARPGLYEYPFGVSMNEILQECGAENVQAVQIGGPSGQLIPPAEFSRKLAFEDLATGGSFMVFNDSRNLLDVIHNFSAFFRHESCGFCTPCRVGTSLLEKQLGKIMVGHATTKDLEYIKTIGLLMKESSHCGLGSTAANPLLDSMRRFPLVYKSRLRSTGFEPSFDVDASLEEARQVTGRTDAGAHLPGGGV